jgi:arylsulfatase A-like enzyme
MRIPRATTLILPLVARVRFGAALARLALLAVAVSSAGLAAAPKTNVLFLIADDLNCDLGAYASSAMRTPNIDRLAARGVKFDHAYCQYPWCCPSRSSFMTGRRPNVTQVFTNPTTDVPMGSHFRDHLPTTITMPQLFKSNGYYAARVGKIYHYGVPNDIGTSSLDDYFSWDLVVNPRGRDREEHDKIFSLEPGQFGGRSAGSPTTRATTGTTPMGSGPARRSNCSSASSASRGPSFSRWASTGRTRPMWPRSIGLTCIRQARSSCHPSAPTMPAANRPSPTQVFARCRIK